MTQIALNEAQQRLPELVQAVGLGEEFIITLKGHPVAKVSQAEEKSLPRRFGSARGKVAMTDDFNAPLEDFAENM